MDGAQTHRCISYSIRLNIWGKRKVLIFICWARSGAIGLTLQDFIDACGAYISWDDDDGRDEHAW